MWRTVLLMIAYVPWMSIYILFAFAVLYAIPPVALLATWGWLAIYGGLSFFGLLGHTSRPFLQATLVPLPLSLFLFGWDLETAGDPYRAAQWLWSVPAHLLGALSAMWWTRRHTGRRGTSD
jgi:hypothetical protein